MDLEINHELDKLVKPSSVVSFNDLVDVVLQNRSSRS